MSHKRQPCGTHNTLQAVVSVFLDLPIEEIPPFFEIRDDKDGWKKYCSFLEARGFDVLVLGPQYEKSLGCPYIAIGQRGHEKLAHCVLRKNGKLIYDPHPSADDLSETVMLQVLCPLDPAAHVTKPVKSSSEGANG